MIKSKNILIISPFFFPEPISTGKFNTDMALALRDEGYNVTVLCSHPLYPKWKPEKSNETLEGITIVRGGANIRYSEKIILRRAILEVWFACFIFIKIFRYRNKVDLIIPIFPPSLFFYMTFILMKSKTRKVGMVHDLQEVYSQGKKSVLGKVISFFINKVEGRTLRACDKLIFLSNEMKETAQALYNLNDKKLVVQYPFITLKEDVLTNDLNDILPKGSINIVYSGALGEKQNPTGLYEFYDFASKKLKDANFHIFSQGQLFEKLKGNNSNAQIKFHDLVASNNIEELYRKSTVQIIPQMTGTSKGSLPSKLPNLLKAGCNILFITDEGSEVDQLFRGYKLEKVVTTWENSILFDALSLLLKNGNKKNENQVALADKLFNMNTMTKEIIS